MQVIVDPQWQETVYTAIHWYTRTNGTAPGVDGSVVLVQAALERLAWQVLVHDKGIFSARQFTGLPAAHSLRLLLNESLIPLSIPAGLKQLSSVAPVFKWADGPQAFVGTRNSIVHPPKKSKSGAPPLAIADS